MNHSPERLELATLPGCGVGRCTRSVRLRPDALGQRGDVWDQPRGRRDADVRDIYCPSGHPALKPRPHPAGEGKPLPFGMG